MLDAKKGEPSKAEPVIEKTRKAKTRSGAGGGRIRCPKCAWRPRKDSRWLCSKCGCAWNTFDTRGRCPDCSYQWRWTVCLSCHEWSLHEAWYQGGELPE
jgi:hypothetical protein